MKRSRFTEEQIINFIKQAEAGMPIKELCRKGDCWDTQSNIAPSAAFGLTRAGIGVVPLR